MSPQRIQRKRTKGWRMPEGAVYVGRPTQWGNPWKAGDVIAVEWNSAATTRTYRELLATPELAVSLYRIAFTPDADEIRDELAGRDLACWCPIEDENGNRFPCHADVLLEIANQTTHPARTQETR